MLQNILELAAHFHSYRRLRHRLLSNASPLQDVDRLLYFLELIHNLSQLSGTQARAHKTSALMSMLTRLSGFSYGHCFHSDLRPLPHRGRRWRHEAAQMWPLLDGVLLQQGLSSQGLILSQTRLQASASIRAQGAAATASQARSGGCAHLHPDDRHHPLRGRQVRLVGLHYLRYGCHHELPGRSRSAAHSCPRLPALHARGCWSPRWPSCRLFPSQPLRQRTLHRSGSDLEGLRQTDSERRSKGSRGGGAIRWAGCERGGCQDACVVCDVLVHGIRAAPAMLACGGEVDKQELANRLLTPRAFAAAYDDIKAERLPKEAKKFAFTKDDEEMCWASQRTVKGIHTSRSVIMS